MKEKIKNIIRRKTLVIPVFLAIVIALIIYGIGVQRIHQYHEMIMLQKIMNRSLAIWEKRYCT